MTAQEQSRRLDDLEAAQSARSEMKLRQLAVEIVDGTHDGAYVGPEVRIPVRGKLRYEPATEGLRASPSRFHVVTVAPISELLDPSVRNEALLIVEEIIRPQLREAGWSV